jgi:hypothetical protein
MGAPTIFQTVLYTIHTGLAIYCFGSVDPTFLMPGPHRFQIPGDGRARLLIAGLIALGRQAFTTCA